MVHTSLLLHLPALPGASQSMILVISGAIMLLVVAGAFLVWQRPLMLRSRGRHPENIPTWGDLYLDSLAEAHRRPHRLSRGRTSTS